MIYILETARFRDYGNLNITEHTTFNIYIFIYTNYMTFIPLKGA